MSTTQSTVLATTQALACTQRVVEAARAALLQLDEQFHREQQHRARVINAVRTFDALKVLRLLEGGPEEDGHVSAGAPAPKPFELGYQTPSVDLAGAVGAAEEVQAWRAVTPKASVVRAELDGLLVELVEALGEKDPFYGRFYVPHVLGTAHLLVSVGCRARVVDGVPLRDLLHQAWRYKQRKDDANVVQAVLDRWLKPPRKQRAKPDTRANTNPGA